MISPLDSALSGLYNTLIWPAFFIPFFAAGFGLGRTDAQGQFTAFILFASALAAGAMLTNGRMFDAAPQARAGMLLSSGLLVLLPRSLLAVARPLFAAAAGALGGILVGLEGLLANGPWTAYIAGAWVGGLVLVAAGFLPWLLARQAWFHIAARILGSWLVAGAVLLLGLSL